MISIDEISGEIAKLESQPATYTTMERLSWLYIVRDHMKDSAIPPVTGSEIPKGESDYYCACAGKSIGQVMEIMDELMNVLLVIQPRLYNAVMMKLN